MALIITILLVAYTYLGMDYMKQRKEREALTSQVTDVRQTLEQIPQPPQDLEQRLAAAQARLATEQSAFPSKMNSTEVIDTILRLADGCEVKAIPLLTQPWSTEKVGQHDYYVFRLNMAVEGSFSQLTSLVGGLENGELKTLIVEGLSFTEVSEQAEGQSVPEGTIPITASLDVAIYTRSLTSD